MTARMAERAKFAGVVSRFWTGLALAAALGLSGCAHGDSAVFDGNGAPAGDQSASAPVYTPPPAALAASGTYQPVTLGNVTAPVATITPLNIETGVDTGTAVSKTAAALRAKVTDLQASIRQNAQQLADLRNAGATSASAFHEYKAHITTRLQVGTTRGNPELVSAWNEAQSSLDQLTGNINGLNALAKAVAADASTAHYSLDQIEAALNVSGAVDEDHRQLRVLEDETDQTIVLIDRLVTEVSDAVQRQTAYVANERANLTTLASAIKNGEFYGVDLGSPMMAAASAPGSNMASASGTPLVVIRFDRPDVDYQQILYAALRQTLQVRPNAGFSVVAVAPTKGSAAAVQLAQTAAHRYAEEVLRTMNDMGVPTSRLTVASSTDPSVSVSEVRIFVR
jgi:hypothetical protein